MIKSYSGKTPRLGKKVYIAENAFVSGDVVIDDEVSIWAGVSIRGDVNFVRIGRGSNVQDNTVIHVTGEPSHPTVIGEEVTIGHSCVIHGATLQKRCLIGMGAIVLDGAVVEEESMVAAGSLVPPGCVVKKHTLFMGSPAKEKRKLTEDEIEHFAISADNYRKLSAEYLGA